MIKKAIAQAKVIAELERAVREMKAGYDPPFFLMIYPSAYSEKGHKGSITSETVMCFNGKDYQQAKTFAELIDDAGGEFKKQFALAASDIDPAEFEAFKEQMNLEIAALMKRGFDNLKKDPELKSTELAEKMLRELSEKRPN